MLILIVEDDTALLDTYHQFFNLYHYECVLLTAKRVGEALDQLHKVKPDLILLDYLLEGMDSAAVIEKARALFKKPPSIVLITAISKADEIAKKLKINYLLKKPFSLEQLEHILDTEGVPKKVSNVKTAG